MASDEDRGSPPSTTARLPILVGTAWALGLDVPADLIRSGARPGDPILAAIDPTLAARMSAGDFLVGGNGFGRGVDAGRAALALRDFGIAAVVAHSFDPAFEESADRLGLPAVQLNEALVIHTGARLRIDLEGGRVVNMSSGDRFPIRNLGEQRLERLRETMLARS